ncbi:hypothetical protein [Actinoplanes subglobosus]|uniref:Uncharacterized protein n=1 Tax=Actinoplanes subglobosus TaxID=1547892 RepID=A0ABV8J7Q8_9ACTN
MTNLRHYPPIAVFHIPQCPTLGGNGTARHHDVARDDRPHHVDCSCFRLAMTTVAPFVIVEEGDDADHLYAPSQDRPADAARSLCRTCKGTHGSVDEERERIEVRLVPARPPEKAS